MDPLNPNKNRIIARAFPFIDGKAEIWIKETRDPDAVEKCGLINKRGEFVIPPVYDRIEYSGGDTVAVNVGYKEFDTYLREGKWGIVDLNNNVLIPLIYTEMWSWDDGVHFSVEYEGQCGVVNIHGETIIEFKYDFLLHPDKLGIIIAEIAGKQGCINRKGKVVIPFIYDQIYSPWGEDLIPVEYGDQIFYLNSKGERVLF